MDLESGEEFWCELVINGIGGRTIAEAKANISRPELMTWRSYRDKYGSLFFGRRLEQEFARLFVRYFNSHASEDERIEDAREYMLHEEIPPTSFEEERMKAIKKKSA